MSRGFGHTATVPVPWDSAACLEMCHQLGEQWLPTVVQLLAEEICLTGRLHKTMYVLHPSGLIL